LRYRVRVIMAVSERDGPGEGRTMVRVTVSGSIP